MELDRQEQQALAGFFARRFPSDGDRDDLARAAGLPLPPKPSASPVSAWDHLIALASDRRRLGRLARAAAATDRTDANLQRAAALLAAGESRVSTFLLVGLAAGLPLAAVALVAVVAVLAGSFRASEATAAPAPSSDVAAVAADAVAADAVAADVVAVVGSDVGVADVAPAEVAAGDVAPDAVVAPVADVAPPRTEVGSHTASATPARAPTRRVVAAASDPRCSGTPGELIGYWYAGAASPGQAGQTIALPRSMNVRAWAPSQDNHFDLRGPVRCTLNEGDRVRLSADPLFVPMDSYWVPLYGGDLVAQ